MVAVKSVGPLVVVVGETGSGKTTLAIELAKRFNGEVVAADSRTIYKGMDIGTAKPSRKEQAGIPHHLLDVTTPDKPLTVAQYKELAAELIKEIQDRGRLPILVGGTGLYIDAVIYDYSFRLNSSTAERRELNQLSVEELQSRLARAKIPLPKNSQNPRHLIRSIETKGQESVRGVLRSNTLLIGIQYEKDELTKRLQHRIDTMFDSGLTEETNYLLDRYGWECPLLQTSAYQAVKRYLLGEITVEEAKNQCLRNDLRLAKRQRTWFRRNKSIHWVKEQIQAVDLVTTLLNK